MLFRSAFARVFQFGMRLGMRSWTLGAAWWQGDCGPYWGHNAIIRIQPFAEHCRLPVLPGRPPLGGHVLSHDQLEAVLMRRAGYEVRVLPDEGGSWEENPPHLIEFIRRDLRWCQGNMQYFRFVGMPGLRTVSRWQLWIAIAMYLSGPGWMAFTAFGLIRQGPMDAELGMLLLILSLTMNFAPKLATLADVLLRRRLREAFGGAPAVLASALAETLFTMVIVPITALSVTLFMLGTDVALLVISGFATAYLFFDAIGVSDVTPYLFANLKGFLLVVLMWFLVGTTQGMFISRREDPLLLQMYLTLKSGIMTMALAFVLVTFTQGAPPDIRFSFANTGVALEIGRAHV